MKNTVIKLSISGAVLTPIILMIYLGNTGTANDPTIFYTGRDARTGKIVTVQGCRPERLQWDGKCDQGFRWSEFLK